MNGELHEYKNIDANDYTSRELDVIYYVSNGLKDKEIARNLNISLPTVRKNLGNIYEKSNVESKIEFIVKYYLSLINGGNFIGGSNEKFQTQ